MLCERVLVLVKNDVGDKSTLRIRGKKYVEIKYIEIMLEKVNDVKIENIVN